MAMKRTFGERFGNHENSPEIKENLHPETKKELQAIILERIDRFGPNCNLNDIDVSRITDMSWLFSHFKEEDCFTETEEKLQSFNGDISKWDVSKVTDMETMFAWSSFSGDISKWNVSNVTKMGGMFDSGKFNGDISKWNVSKVIDMSFMFANSRFNGDISKWDVSKVTDMEGMFLNGCFNGDISKWDVSKVTDMEGMFLNGCFEGDISKWDVSALEHSTGMFKGNRICGRVCETIQDYLEFLKEIPKPTVTAKQSTERKQPVVKKHGGPKM